MNASLNTSVCCFRALNSNTIKRSNKKKIVREIEGEREKEKDQKSDDHGDGGCGCGGDGKTTHKQVGNNNH